MKKTKRVPHKFQCQVLMAAFVAIGTAMAGSGPAYAAGVTAQDIAKDATTTSDVLTWGMGTQGHRFSPLNQINTETVKNLVPAWSYSYGGEKQRGQEGQPLVWNGKIFVTESYSRMSAINATTGKKIWEYDARLPDGILPCCDVVNRGAALYGNEVIFCTLDAKLVSLNQDTGKVIWKKKLGDYKAGYSCSGAPLIVKNMVVSGVSGGEFGIVGRVNAYDAKTGELVWTRPTVEGWMGYLHGKPNGISGKTNQTWPGDLWKTGGAATWTGGLYDPATNLILWGTGNPAPWNAHLRPGDNLFSTSTLAIDADTGKIKWHYQYTPHDAWDFDGANETIPFTLHENGKTIEAAAHADRNGFFYVLNRKNGKLINAFPFVEKITWASKIDLKTGRPVETGNRPGVPNGKKQGKTVFSAPSFLGGKNWMPMAYNPDTRLFYVPSNEWGMDIWNLPIAYKKGAAYLGAGFTIKPVFKNYIGALRAFDPVTGKKVWEVKNKAPLWGGVLTTAGGLVFAGTPEGYLNAYDAKTGKLLWRFNTGSGVVGCPITWEQNGQQYIAVPSGWGGAVPLWGGEVAKSFKGLNQGGSLWVFKLFTPYTASK